MSSKIAEWVTIAITLLVVIIGGYNWAYGTFMSKETASALREGQSKQFDTIDRRLERIEGYQIETLRELRKEE